MVATSSIPVIVVPPQGAVKDAPPRIVEPSRASGMRLDAESDPFPASRRAALSTKSR
jgi:hypothetical protein